LPSAIRHVPSSQPLPSQDKLAEKADLDRTHLSGIERGVRSPGIKVVIRLARALGVGVDHLCKGVDA
jgi:transcriptional regulator with XRE-family HTH domain